MGWFDEQIKQRKIRDNEVFSDSFEKIGKAVLGKNIDTSKEDVHNTKGAMAKVLKYYGYRISEIPPEIKDFNEQLEYVCRPHGIMHRIVKLTDNWWKDAYGPMLGFLKEDNKAVALIPNGIFGYHMEIDDEIVMITDKTNELIKTTAFCFYNPLPLRKITIADLIVYGIKTRTPGDIALVVGMMGVTTLIGLFIPKISHFLMNDVIKEKSLSLLISTLVFYFFLQIGTSLFNTCKTLFNERVNKKMALSISSATMMRVLSLPPSFFKNYSSGDLNSRVSYVSSLTSTLMNTIFSTGLTSLFSLAYVSNIFQYAPSLVVPALVIIAATLTCSVISTFVMMNLSREQMKVSTEESGMSYAMITGIQKIKLSGAEKRAFARWGNLYAKEAAITYKPIYIELISMVISTIGTIVLYYVAVKSNISQADYYAFNTAYGMVAGAFASLVSIFTTFANIKPSIEMVKPILDAEPEISEGKEVLTRIQGGIEMSHISFRYEDNMPNVIDDMSLKIKPGQYVAIVGKTGCGKSTLIRLLLGFEKAQKGSIFFDGKDINSIDLKSLRRKIGTVMQNGKLFQGDIYTNITIAAPWLKMEDAWEAAELAGIADDIREMPMGMHTVISEGSGGISGGQRQRIVIARAIAPKPRILIFDEATSALDNITQKKISESLDSLKCTRIIIAHRLSTIRHCDRILYLEGGKIVEDGTYDELINLNGKFAELVERQRLDTSEIDDSNNNNSNIDDETNIDDEDAKEVIIENNIDENNEIIDDKPVNNNETVTENETDKNPA